MVLFITVLFKPRRKRSTMADDGPPHKKRHDAKSLVRKRKAPSEGSGSSSENSRNTKPKNTREK